MKSLGIVFASLFLGGVFFWAPTVALSQTTMSHDTFWITVSWASPFLLLIFSAAAFRCREGQVGGPSFFLFALVGVWLTGPWFMTLAGVLRAPEIVRGMALADWTWLCRASVYPPDTLYMSAALGSFYALVAVTVVMPLCHHMLEKDRWFIPPEWRRRFHFRRSHAND